LSLPYDKVDLEARRRAAVILRERFLKVLDDIIRGRPPKLEIPKRTLANTIFDSERGILVLGDEKLEREFLDMGEARRFMQTVLMASIIYQALVENEYPTIRDLYYRGKHTITYKDLRGRLRQENTWDEQAESDAVIRDIEVYTGLLREDMLILSKEKGKVVGNLKIRSGGDVIDLSRMGHGAYAIESTPDLIEFVDWDAEFVLVVEKDAVFQQLHRIGFWKKYKAILVTGAGQPDRATRRFVRRLNEELKLPVYILTDSIPADEVVVVRDATTKRAAIGPIEELIGHFFSGEDKERVVIDLEVPAWDPSTGVIEWRRIGYAYRHRIKDKLLRIKTDGRGEIRVTKAHSLFVLRDGKIAVIPARDIRPGDRVIVASTLPPISSSPEYTLDGIDGRLSSVENGMRHSRQLLDTRVSAGNTYLLQESYSEAMVEALNEDTAWVLGLLTVRGAKDTDGWFSFEFSQGEVDVVGRLREIVEETLGGEALVEFTVEKKVRVRLRSAYLSALIGDHVHANGLARRITEVILDSSLRTILGYIKGVIDGGERCGVTCINVKVEDSILGKQLFNLLLSAGFRLRYLDDKGIIRVEEHPNKPDTVPLVGDVEAVKVVSVAEEDYDGYVYDFMVPEGNSFVGGHGIVYHNSDPYGFYIYSVYKVGSIQLSYESVRLATPKARFLGVSMTDIFGYRSKKPFLSERERKNFIIKATDADIKRAKELMKYSWFKSKGWKRELKIFLSKKAKLEIEALASKGLKFLAFEYIPKKMETGDWLE